MKILKVIVVAAAIGISAGAGGRLVGLLSMPKLLHQEQMKNAEDKPVITTCRHVNPDYNVNFVFDAKNWLLTTQEGEDEPLKVSLKEQTVVVRSFREYGKLSSYVSTILAGEDGYIWVLAGDPRSNVGTLTKSGNGIFMKFICQE